MGLGLGLGFEVKTCASCNQGRDVDPILRIHASISLNDKPMVPILSGTITFVPLPFKLTSSQLASALNSLPNHNIALRPTVRIVRLGQLPRIQLDNYYNNTNKTR